MSTFAGKVVLITGASSGIGQGTAIHFAKLKAKLSLMGRNAENLEKVSKQCQIEGLNQDEILTYAGDINNTEDRKALIDKTIEKFGHLDILVNNAGLIRYKSTTQTTEEDYDDMMNTNVRSQLFLTQLALPHIIKVKDAFKLDKSITMLSGKKLLTLYHTIPTLTIQRKKPFENIVGKGEDAGNIVNNSSICGSRSMPMVGTYCMSKAAMDMFTKCLALEMAPHGVRVNAISPGTIVSNIARRADGPFQDDESYAKFLEIQSKGHPLGRVGVPQDCAEAIAYLASDSSSFITGQIIYIDGGRNCVSVGVPSNN